MFGPQHFFDNILILKPRSIQSLVPNKKNVIPLLALSWSRSQVKLHWKHF